MVTTELKKNIEKKALQLRYDILSMLAPGKVGHLGGSSSCADIVAALYFYKMKIDPEYPYREDRDRFLLSKGHAALVQYAALAELGFFPKEELKKVKTLDGILQGHPDMRKTPGIEANTGSLGQGLSIALGISLGLRLDKNPGKVYVILGDGELAEGQIWEAAMAAANFGVDSLVAIVDQNKAQATGMIVERFNTNPLVAKWEAFGWQTLQIDGHNVEEIIEALDEADEVTGKPVVIIAETVKGKGFSFAEHKAAYHNAALTQEEYETALADLEEIKKSLSR